jgi:hypothetical protein
MGAVQSLATDQNLYHEVARVPVVPGVKPIKTATKGGPIWPDFATETALRHCRNGVPVDLQPDAPEAIAEVIPAAIWGCFLDLRFGHLIAEHLSRLPLALRHWPDLPVLFVAADGISLADIPTWVWEVFDWIGLAPERVHLVTAPVLVERLCACGQQEMMMTTPPSQIYLDLLTSWTDQLPAQPCDLLYVTRRGLVTQGRGGHAGEGYLVRLLQQAGVTVLDPLHASIPQQLAAYAGAKTIVFVEGSAVHGRQLLGHIAQDLHILRRRDGQSIARRQLLPRCQKLRYRDVAGARLPVFWKSGARRDDADLRLYDLEGLWDTFESLGVPLHGKWRGAEYRTEAIRDIEAWAAVRKPKGALLADYVQTLRKARTLPAAWQKPPKAQLAAAHSDSDR